MISSLESEGVRPGHWNVDVLHSGRGNSLLFFFWTGRPIWQQVNYGFDTDSGEIAKSLRSRLTAAIDMRVNLVEVIDSGRRQGKGRNGAEQKARQSITEKHRHIYIDVLIREGLRKPA